jgi:2-hydroxy-3-keto-5-methylthiopentenyl-1-phosphate phosphatase
MNANGDCPREAIMSKPKKPIIAICYDFDGTLSPRNMQEYDYIPQLRLSSKKFWREVEERAKNQGADAILSYMRLMVEKATITSGVKITCKSFEEFGKTVELFPGVLKWFKRINEYGNRRRAVVQHFIISSGIKEMIQGTPIAKKFNRIYASSFMFDQNGVAYWPALALNFTTKTQFLFRINKGVLDSWDNTKINDYIPMDKRPIPFSRIIYIGDGSTDIPCMKLTKEQGGYSIAVYPPGSKKKSAAKKLLVENRVNFVAPANYNKGHSLDLQVKAVIDKMLTEHVILKREKHPGLISAGSHSRRAVYNKRP